MDFTIRPATVAEQQYCYSQSAQIEGQAGCIGHLRADFGAGGDQFFTSWFNHNAEWNNQEFSDDLDVLINALRGNQPTTGSPPVEPQETFLKSRTALAAFCRTQPENVIKGTSDREMAFRADSSKHAFILRLNPGKGEYNLYCYCYRRDFLDRHLKNAERGIRFITPNYKELFRIEDGDKIRITSPLGDVSDQTCRYIDDTHFELDSGLHSRLFHICEFSELMERNGNTILPLRNSLPELCYSYLPTTNEIAVLHRGEQGYSPTDIPVKDADEGRAIAEARNKKLGVSKAQAQAMECGTMFGFDTPGADPRRYDEHGMAIKKTRPVHSTER